MKIVRARYLADGNTYGCKAVVRLVVSDDAERDARSAAAVARSIQGTVPSICGHHPDRLNFPVWRMLQDCRRSISTSLLVEALALLVQRWVDWPVGFSGAELEAEVPDTVIVYETRQAEAGLRAGDVAVELFNAACVEAPERMRAVFVEKLDAYRAATTALTPVIDSIAIAIRAERRGIPWATVPGVNYLRLGYGSRRSLVQGSETTQLSSIGKMLAKHKSATNVMLAAAGLPVAVQRSARTGEEALEAARWIGFPVVVKPATGNMGRGVSVGIGDDKHLAEAFEQARSVSREVVIESVIPGDEYRLLVVGGRFFAASRRLPAQVRGDGLSTVHQLVEQENLSPERHPSVRSALKPIDIDGAARSCLALQGLSPDAVPRAGQVVLLRFVSNISQGGTAVDVTDIVHPSVRDLAERAAAVVGIDVCGVDFITLDVGKPFWETGGAICEINTRPMLGIHMAVMGGTPRDAADAVVAMLFPPGAPSRIPLLAVLRDADQTALEGALRDAASVGYRRIGLVSSSASPISPLAGVEAILWDGRLDAAIIGLTPPDVVRYGVGLDRVDLAILPSGARTPFVQQACEVLTRLADGHVVDHDDPAVWERALDALGTPTEPRHGPTGIVGASAKSGSAVPAAVTRRERGEPDFILLLVGDIGFGECYAPRSGMARLWPRLAIDGHRFSLARLMDLLRHADLVVGNLEVPLAETPNPALRHTKKYLHWSDPNETVAALVAGGFGALSLANNHSLDCGPAGLAETTRLLRAAGLVPFGAGPDLATAALPYVRTVAVGPVKKTIVVFGGFELRPDYEKLFDWYARTDRAGANPIDPDAVSSQITQLRDTLPDPLFVAYPHWGVDYRDTMPAQRDLAAALITAGVDLVIGHGAHLLQGIETIRGRKVIYGLGNFVFNSPGRFAKHVAPPYGLVAALRLYHGEAGVSAALRLYPLFVDNAISDFQSRPVSAGEFPDARAVLTKHYDGLAGDLAFGVDRVGHYLETPIQM